MQEALLTISIRDLIKFCEKEKFVGYSLYDSHNSPAPFAKFGRTPSFLINQLNKRSPLNLRPLLGIKKGINPKGYGLFLHAYSLLSQLNAIDSDEAIERSHFFFEWLVRNPSKGYSGHCWGYNYHWPKKDGSDVPPYTPSVVVTGFVARAMLSYFLNTGNEAVKGTLKSMASFVMQDVHLYKGDDGYCFSYTPVKRDLTINANLLAAEVLAYCDHANNENEYQEYVKQVLQFTVNHQNEDGSWYYSFDYKSRKPKKQIDFHQGYVLESLLRISQYSRVDCSSYAENINRGLHYYFHNQFHEQGWAYWRIPSKWPVDIHNQSQGIITFTQFKDCDERYAAFAQKIAEWTIKNMQGRHGNFFYQKWPFLNNKVNYLRWNQAWMLLALSTLLSSLDGSTMNRASAKKPEYDDQLTTPDPAAQCG